MQPLISHRDVRHANLGKNPWAFVGPQPAGRATERIAYLEWLAERYPEDGEGYSRLDEREPPVSFEEWRARR